METKTQESKFSIGETYNINGIKNCYYIGKSPISEFKQNGKSMEFYKFIKTGFGMLGRVKEILTVNIPESSQIEMNENNLSIAEKDKVIDYQYFGIRSWKKYFNGLNKILEDK